MLFRRSHLYKSRDFFQGPGWLAGSLPPDPNPNSPDGRTKVMGEPTPLQVNLLDGKTRRIIDSQRSKPDGTWRFEGLKLNHHFAIEFVNQNGVHVDNNGAPYNSFIQDFIYAMPPEYERITDLRIRGGESASFYIDGSLHLDPNLTHSSIDLSYDQLSAIGNSNSGGQSKLTHPKSSGKWYIESELTSFSSTGSNGCGLIGISPVSTPTSSWLGQTVGEAALWRVGNSITFYLNGSSVNTGVSATDNDVAMMAWDSETGKVWFGVNGQWLNDSDPSSDTNPTAEHVSLIGEHHFATGPRNANNRVKIHIEPNHPIPSGFSYLT